jgi:proteasome lid subunit RPN8/RPN11
MLQALVSTASRLLHDLNRSLFRRPLPPPEEPVSFPERRAYQRLQRVVLTDQVCRTIFEEYADHRHSTRGDEETGWVLLGLREADEVVVLATLPAGAHRSAGIAHVRFNASAQALASRMVRQQDRRLSIVGVVHTHPGSLRHPSDGDFQGDRLWVSQLRARDGIFAIGTADGETIPGTMIATQPRPHVQCLGELCLTWFALAEGDRHYRPMPVHMTLGPDLARPLHGKWELIEKYAEPLDRLFHQQARVTAEATQDALVVELPLAQPNQKLRLILDKKKVRYLLHRGQEVIEVDPQANQVDQGVYLVLAELAGRQGT